MATIAGTASIHSSFGPRQVGKTTLALQVVDEIGKPSHYISADFATLQDLTWLQQQWELARLKAKTHGQALLIIDEIQKIPHWSEIIKGLWDQDTKNKTDLSVLILGLSPWLVQKGLSESLAGRFEIIPATHWSYSEMHGIFGWSLDKYLYFGGDPGAASLANEEDSSRWVNYISESLQILSYSKMLGELQDAGNTTTLAHYLELLSGAGLLAGLQKFAQQKIRQKGSSPKFSVFNTALITAQSSKSYHEAKKDRAFWGQIVESAVGAYLLNSIRGTQIELFFWREGDKEVDFILKYNDKLTAIEVKSNSDFVRHTGLDLFVRQFNPSHLLLVREKGIPLIDFLSNPVWDYLK